MTDEATNMDILMAAGGPMAGIGLPSGGEMDAANSGIVIRLSWRLGAWNVYVPDYNFISNGTYTPGTPLPFKYVPLKDWLKVAEAVFRLTPKEQP